MSPWMTKGLLVVAAVSSLTACGGDDENSLRAEDRLGNTNPPGFFAPPVAGTPSSPTAAAGLWFGVARPDTNPNAGQPMVALVTEDGDFVSIAAYSNVDVYLFVGENTGNGGNFDVDAATYDGGVEYQGVSSLIGTAVAGTSLNGSYAVGTTTGQFELDYSNLYERSASLAKLQGVYTYEGVNGLHSVVVDTSGNLSGELYDGCTIDGSVTTPRADRNYYRFTGTLGDCSIYDGPMHGLIYLEDDDIGGTDNVIVLLGETDSRGTGIFASGAK